MSKKADKQESKISKCVKAPFRMLRRARDMYVNSLSDCSGKMNYGGGAVGPVRMMPRSFTSNSSRSYGEDDFRELVRAASLSQRICLSEKLEMEIRRSQRFSSSRSTFSGIERIEEEDCEEDFTYKGKTVAKTNNLLS